MRVRAGIGRPYIIYTKNRGTKDRITPPEIANWHLEVQNQPIDYFQGGTNELQNVTN